MFVSSAFQTYPPVGLRRFAIVACGGGIIGSPRPSATPTMQLRCPGCRELYPLAVDPVGLGLGPQGATVQQGYVETCPRCWHESYVGTVLAVEVACD
jgi:hypothetical protein